MPNSDGTGPMGQGSMTGRRLGRCQNSRNVDINNQAVSNNQTFSDNQAGFTNQTSENIRGSGRGFNRNNSRGSTRAGNRGFNRGRN